MSREQRAKAEILIDEGYRVYSAKVRDAFAQFRECLLAKGYKPIQLELKSYESRRRLLSLNQFCGVIGLEFCEALGILIEYWQKHTKMAKNHLPVSVRILTGNRSFDILREHTAEHGDMKQFVKHAKREAILGFNVFSDAAWHDSHLGYDESLRTGRERREQAETRLKRTLLAYRGNPWR